MKIIRSKKILLIICTVIGFLISMTNCSYNQHSSEIKIPTEIQDSIKLHLKNEYKKDSLRQAWGYKIEKLEPILTAMIQVESQGNEQAIGDKHLNVPSYGILQIRPILVDDCNLILQRQGSDKQYCHIDALDKEKSIEMFVLYIDYYVPDYNYEKIARVWNGGPKAIYKNTSQYYKTNSYWNKVKKELYI